MPRLLPSLLALSLALAATPALAEAKSATPADRADEARAHLKAIARLDDAPGGPQINAVIVFNPAAAKEAERLAGTGPLDGRTVLVKDNVETREWATTAGSLALKDNRTGRDAPLIARMRAAGGVVLGKTNLSEWANIRHSDSTSGWSAVGGLTRNPHALDRNACGSSSGSGAAIAAGMAWAAIGTETDGSITCPAAINGIVGFKPTVGLVSRTHVVPISASQDTAGPMTRTVADAALLLGAIAGSDPADAATAEADARKVDYTRGLATASLKGVRIGVLRSAVGNHEGVKRVFAAGLADRAGAAIATGAVTTGATAATFCVRSGCGGVFVLGSTCTTGLDFSPSPRRRAAQNRAPSNSSKPMPPANNVDHQPRSTTTGSSTVTGAAAAGSATGSTGVRADSSAN